MSTRVTVRPNEYTRSSVEVRKKSNVNNNLLNYDNMLKEGAEFATLRRHLTVADASSRYETLTKSKTHSTTQSLLGVYQYEDSSLT